MYLFLKHNYMSWIGKYRNGRQEFVFFLLCTYIYNNFTKVVLILCIYILLIYQPVLYPWQIDNRKNTLVTCFFLEFSIAFEYLSICWQQSIINESTINSLHISNILPAFSVQITLRKLLYLILCTYQFNNQFCIHIQQENNWSLFLEFYTAFEYHYQAADNIVSINQLLINSFHISNILRSFFITNNFTKVCILVYIV